MMSSTSDATEITELAAKTAWTQVLLVNMEKDMLSQIEARAYSGMALLLLYMFGHAASCRVLLCTLLQSGVVCLLGL
jgi:hypothetical protein